jgi:deazaflavin-dependent oxidoreductase (nitroreductase family)
MTTAKKNDLHSRLERYREINLTVVGRKSGRSLSRPVWFVLDGDRLYLLPVKGSDSEWYRNILKTPRMSIDARGESTELHAVAITKPAEVKAVVDKFKEKYGAEDVKKYYSKFDVAVAAKLA